MYETLLSPGLIKTIVICFTILVSFILFIIGIKKKWFTSFSISKSGLDVKVSEVEKQKEEEKKFESGSINYLLDNHIHKLDFELVEFALVQAGKLRRTLVLHFSKNLTCAATRIALISCLRFPLYEASRRNNFKDVLLPEHLKWYVDKILKEMITEYQEFSLVREITKCSVNENVKCQDLPSLDSIIDVMKKEIIENWAIPIRRKTCEIHEKKIQLYMQFIQSYKDLNDMVRIKITEQCIEKNRISKEKLSRKPDLEKGEL